MPLFSPSPTPTTQSSPPDGYNLTTDPIAILSFILLIFTIFLFLFLLIHTTRLSSLEIWDKTMRYRQQIPPSSPLENSCPPKSTDDLRYPHNIPPLKKSTSTPEPGLELETETGRGDEEATHPLLLHYLLDNNANSKDKRKHQLATLPRLDTNPLTTPTNLTPHNGRKNVHFSNTSNVQAIPSRSSVGWEPTFWTGGEYEQPNYQHEQQQQPHQQQQNWQQQDWNVQQEPITEEKGNGKGKGKERLSRHHIKLAQKRLEERRRAGLEGGID